jgi:hypothetical protein
MEDIQFDVSAADTVGGYYIPVGGYWTGLEMSRTACRWAQQVVTRALLFLLLTCALDGAVAFFILNIVVELDSLTNLITDPHHTLGNLIYASEMFRLACLRCQA